MVKKGTKDKFFLLLKRSNLKTIKLILFLLVVFIIWQLKIPSVDISPILPFDENEIKVMILYALGLMLLPLGINVLIFLSAFLLVGLQSQELVGIIVFMSLIAVLLKSVNNLFEK